MKRDYFQWWVGTATQPKPPLHGNAQRCQTGCLGGRVKISIDTNYHSKTNKPCLWQKKIKTWSRPFTRPLVAVVLISAYMRQILWAGKWLWHTDWNVRPMNEHTNIFCHYVAPHVFDMVAVFSRFDQQVFDRDTLSSSSSTQDIVSLVLTLRSLSKTCWKSQTVSTFWK